MRRLIIGAVLAVAMTAPAKASVMIDRDHINAGDSVYLYFTPDPLDVANLQPELPIPPGQPWSYAALDIVYSGSHSLFAPGSVQDYYNDYFCSGLFTCSFGTDNPTVKLTYLIPGDYVINYIDGYRLDYYYLYLMTPDADGYPMIFLNAANQLVTSGSVGSFEVTVAAVPEPSTWVMMLLGFIFIAAAARSRRLSLT